MSYRFKTDGTLKLRHLFCYSLFQEIFFFDYIWLGFMFIKKSRWQWWRVRVLWNGVYVRRLFWISVWIWVIYAYIEHWILQIKHINKFDTKSWINNGLAAVRSIHLKIVKNYQQESCNNRFRQNRVRSWIFLRSLKGVKIKADLQKKSWKSPLLQFMLQNFGPTSI